VAWINFDMAVPGTGLEDVAYLAWSWCISSMPDRGPATDQAHQLRRLCHAYGLDVSDRHNLIDAVTARQSRNTAWWRDHDAHGAAEIAVWSDGERVYTDRHRDVFTAALA
jgi:aminoglycoside phosphotransferase (APT) family kinase protein